MFIMDPVSASATPAADALGGAGSSVTAPLTGALEPSPPAAATASSAAAVDAAEITAAVSKDGLKVDVVSGRLHSVYDVGKAIGKGKFSTVYKAIRRSDGVAVALKQIAIFDMMDEKSRDKCLKEIKLVQSLNHENIIRYLDGFIEDKQLILVFEYAGKCWPVWHGYCFPYSAVAATVALTSGRSASADQLVLWLLRRRRSCRSW